MVSRDFTTVKDEDIDLKWLYLKNK
jgi:hypothetical protein